MKLSASPLMRKSDRSFFFCVDCECLNHEAELAETDCWSVCLSVCLALTGKTLESGHIELEARNGV